MLQESLLIWSSNQKKKLRNQDINNPKSSPIIDENQEVLKFDEMNLNLSDENEEVLEMAEILNSSDENQDFLKTDGINLSKASLNDTTVPGDINDELVVEIHNEQFELSDEPELSDTSI